MPAFATPSARLSVAVEALEVCPADGPELPYPLDGVAVPPAGAGEPAAGVVVVVGCGGRGAGSVGSGDVVTGGRRTGSGAVVTGGGGTGTVGTDTVGVGSEGTGRVGVVVVGTGSVGAVTVGTGRVGTGSDGAVTVGTGTSIALPACTNRCAAANPAAATNDEDAVFRTESRPQTSDRQYCSYNADRSIRDSASRQSGVVSPSSDAGISARSAAGRGGVAGSCEWSCSE